MHATKETLFKEEFFGDYSPVADQPLNDAWPNLLRFHLKEGDTETLLADTVRSGLPTPHDWSALSVGVRRVGEDGGYSFLVICSGEHECSDGKMGKIVAFTNSSYGDAAYREAWVCECKHG